MRLTLASIPMLTRAPTAVPTRVCHGHGWVTQRLVGLKRELSEEMQGLALAWSFASLLRYHNCAQSEFSRNSTDLPAITAACGAERVNNNETAGLRD